MKMLASIVLLIGSIALHVWALYTGLYEAQMHQGVVWFDNVLHTAVGAGFGLLWLAILDRVAPTLPRWVRAVSTVLFVMGMAAAWELFELGFYIFFETHTLGLKVYSPTMRESLFDSSSNLIGVLVLLCIDAFTRRLVRSTV
jgi:hypothetical protein